MFARACRRTPPACVRAVMTAAANAPVSSAGQRAWTVWAIAQLNADAQRSADTHLIPVPLPGFPAIDLYLKDESSHPTGSLKHRLARSLFLYALVNGWVSEGCTVIESSSGSTAVSEAYFAKLLGLRFVAVMPAGTSPAKVALIERYGGSPHFVASASAGAAEAQRLAATTPRAHFMDQFTFASIATDFRGNNNLAASLFAQMQAEHHPTPAYVVCGVGTGGTSTTLGRYVRHRGVKTEVVIADPERSAFYEFFVHGDAAAAAVAAAAAAVTPSGSGGGRIEGIGRPRVEPSFVRTAVDGAVAVPDAYSFGAMAYLERCLGRRVGGSTGTIFCAALTLAERMRVAGETGSIVGILCDGGERYKDTLFSPVWRAENGLMAAACDAAAASVAALADPDGEDSPWRRPLAAAASPAPTRLGTAAWPMTLARRRDE